VPYKLSYYHHHHLTYHLSLLSHAVVKERQSIMKEMAHLRHVWNDVMGLALLKIPRVAADDQHTVFDDNHVIHSVKSFRNCNVFTVFRYYGIYSILSQSDGSVPRTCVSKRRPYIKFPVRKDDDDDVAVKPV